MPELGVVAAEDRYKLLLDISRIVNAPLEYSAVIDAIAEALAPFTAIDTLVLLTVKNDHIFSHSIHMAGVERHAGDSFHDIAARGLGLCPEEAARVPLVRDLAGSNLEHAARTGRPYVVNHFDESKVRFDAEHKLIAFGVKAYVLCPLMVRGKLIGALALTRRRQDYFADEEVRLFEDISSILAIAMANSLAYEQIRNLKDQLQAENLLLREEIAGVTEFDEMVGRSRAIRKVIDAVEKVAATESTVLICGETGTGKELVARAIHRLSPRGSKPLIKLHCAALPESLIASELFGHERGAFTGAVQRRIGRFESATGSSLFLDEVGEIPLDVQVALLRVMQEREFERLGGTQTIRADVRLIAATNRDLPQAIAEGAFRSDLYYRLNVFPINVPPLRERAEDIPLLVDSFLARFGHLMGRKMRAIDGRTMDLFLSYSWPGNIRELQNVVERAVILAEDGILRVDANVLSQPSNAPVGISLLREQERESIEAMLAETGGRISGPRGAASRLRMPASTLESKIRALGINKHRFRQVAASRASA